MDAIVDIIEENPPSPMTVRQVFYALTVRGAVEKTEAEYNRTVVRLLTEMRWDGTIDWNSISDASRWVHAESGGSRSRIRDDVVHRIHVPSLY